MGADQPSPKTYIPLPQEMSVSLEKIMRKLSTSEKLNSI